MTKTDTFRKWIEGLDLSTMGLWWKQDFDVMEVSPDYLFEKDNKGYFAFRTPYAIGARLIGKLATSIANV